MGGQQQGASLVILCGENDLFERSFPFPQNSRF
jgi:hypothetical protein